MRRSRVLFVLSVVLLGVLVFCPLEALARRPRWAGGGEEEEEEEEETTPEDSDDDPDDEGWQPPTDFLLDMVGREIYAYLRKPTYRFILYMTVGKLPDEDTFIEYLSLFCNLLYGISIFWGFILLNRSMMLFVTLVTLYVGPAIVLVLLGSIGISLVAFALYPGYSAFAMFLFFFLTSRTAQVLGRQLGLDADKDGDVDFMDLLHYASTTHIGKALKLEKLHEIFNEPDPFKEIIRRLDKLIEDTKKSEKAEKKD